MNTNKTERGFSLITFTDRYGATCSLQKSSLATEDCVWLGAGDKRMHLTREMVADLLPYLQDFVKTGELKTGAEVPVMNPAFVVADFVEGDDPDTLAERYGVREDAVLGVLRRALAEVPI